MARYKQLPVLSSRDLGDVNNFLEQLKEAALFKARLKELEDLKAQINADIEIYGKANEIGRLNSMAITNHESSKKMRDEALADRALASEEIRAAKEAAQQFIDERETKSVLRIADREKVLVDGEADLDRREKAVAKSLDELASRETQAAADIASAIEIRTQYTKAVASLKTAIEDTAKAL